MREYKKFEGIGKNLRESKKIQENSEESQRIGDKKNNWKNPKDSGKIPIREYEKIWENLREFKRFWEKL